jgi:hypothetical protein
MSATPNRPVRLSVFSGTAGAFVVRPCLVTDPAWVGLKLRGVPCVSVAGPLNPEEARRRAEESNRGA